MSGDAPPDRPARLDAGAVALMLVLCASWGVSQVAIKVANAEIAPILQGGLRSAGAAILVLAWSYWRRVPLFGRDGTLGAGLVAAALFSAEFAFVYVGLIYTTAARAVLFLYVSPFVVALGAHLFVPGERIRRRQLLGLGFAFVGVAIAFAEALALPTRRELLGDAMELFAAVLWGATTVVIKASRLARASPSKTLLYQLVGSAFALTALSWALGEHSSPSPGALTVAALLYQIVWVAFATYLAWFWLIGRYPAGRLAAFTFLTPLMGAAAGAVLLHEPIGAVFAGALLLVAFGIVLVNSRG